MFISKLGQNTTLYLLWVFVTMFSICFHEFCHAYVAMKQGDDTAAEEGHLTLNPLRQMGIISIIMLLLIGISWGAVPVNLNRLRHRYSYALVSFAGPAGNLILFIVFGILYCLFENYFIDTYAQMFYLGGIINMLLFLFNMLPLPILDGWSVFSYFFPQLRRVNDEMKNALTFVVFILFFMTPLANGLFSAGQHIFNHYITLIHFLPLG